MTTIKRLRVKGFKSFAKPTDIEFGTKFNVVIGANGSGKCVTGDTLVHLADGSLARIDKLVNQKIAAGKTEKTEDGFIAYGDQTKVLSLDTESYKIAPCQILAYVKRKSPESLLKIRTRSGRKITATKYHPLFVLDEGKIKAIKSEKLKEGTRIAVPRFEPIKRKNPYFFELIDEIKRKDNLYVSYKKDFKKQLKKIKRGSWKKTAKKIGVPYNTIKGLQDKQAVNFADIVKILRCAGLNNKEITKQVTSVRTKNHSDECRMIWKNSPEFARLFGYILSEGRCAKESNQVWFTNSDENLIIDYVKVMKQVFGVAPSIKEYKPNCWDVLVYSKAIIEIFRKFGVGEGSGEKNIDDLFLKHCSEKEIGSLIEGLYGGDGYVSKSSIEITTKSVALAKKIQTILDRLGVLSRSTTIVKIATNTGFSGVYKKIAIYGANECRQLSKFVRFRSKEKQERFEQLCKKKANTNVDVIEANALVKDVCEDYGVLRNSRELRKKYPFLGAYSYEGTLPSRQGLQIVTEQIIGKHEKTVNAQILEKLAYADIFWDEIEEIEEVKSKEEWVYDLCVAKQHNFIANRIIVHNSNVIDALCFVLGKLSAKSLRAEKSANLIFNGGKKSNPLKEAEVSIFFDNNAKEFPLQTEEIKVTRVIRSNGNSIYKINDETRTRQEILELLAAAKINPEGHNIVLQGDIIHFMEMHPEDRRTLIEDTAGITVYEDRKQKAMLELEKVEKKLSEATIILTERETYLKELKKERDQAMKYKDLEKNIKTNKATYLKLQINEREDERKIVEEKIEKTKGEIKKIETKIKDYRNDIDRNRKELEQINDEIEEKGEKEAIALQKEIEALNKEVIKKSERLNTCRNEITKVGERKKQLRIALDDIDKTVTGLEKTKGEIQGKVSELTKKLQETEKSLEKVKGGQNISNIGTLDKLEKEIDAGLIKLQALQEKKQSFLQKKFQIDAQVAAIDERVKKTEENEKKADLKGKRQEYEKIKEEFSKKGNEHGVVERQLEEVNKEYFANQSELYKLRAQESGMKETLLADKAVKRILDLNDRGIFGTLNQLGKVENKYAVALEVAAGARMKSIVVENDKKAADCINLLKQERLGTATFLPLNKIQPRQQATLQGPGIHGNAMDLVSFDKKFKDVFSYVFANTLVVEDIETARKIGIGKYRMVSLDGDIAETSGVMIGGFRTKARGLGFQEKEVNSGVETAQQEEDKLGKLKETLERRKGLLDKELKELSIKKSSLEGELIKTEKTLDTDVSKLEKEKEALLQNKTVKDVNVLSKEIETATEGIAALKEEREKIKKTIKDIRNPEIASSIERLEARRQTIREELIQAATEIKNIDMQKENIYYPEKEKTSRIIKQHEKESEEFRKEQERLEKEVKEQNGLLNQKEDDERKFQREYKDLFARRNKLNEEIRKHEEGILGEENRIKEVNERSNDIVIKRAKIVAELEGLSKEYEEFRGIEVRTNISVEKVKDEVKRFEKLLVEMGNVNLKALEVYEDIKVEYEKILDKMAKLKEEKEDVLQMMYGIESKKKETFMRTYTTLSENFTKIFAMLTTKAEALLELENKEDPLSAGVDIKVRLAGNKFLDIKSLSGGEKTLAALAFIFAIQEFNPASFYLMDEVDAALDKRNSNMLSKFINKYAERAQYIIISHNDEMISEAEYIYGVSMQESGMSKIISLKV